MARIKNFIMNLKRMPFRIKRIFEILELQSTTPVSKQNNFNIMKEQISVILNLMLLEKINPSIVKALIPELSATSDLLTFDVHHRLQKEKAVALKFQILHLH